MLPVGWKAQFNDRSIARLAMQMGLILGTCIQLSGQNYNFKHFTDRDGMPQSQIQALYRDREGFLWAGSFSGLGRYDGTRWKVFSQEQGLNRNYITALVETREGRLLVGIRQGGVKIYSQDRFEFVSENAFLSSCNVQSLLCDDKGRVWVAANEGLALIDGMRVRIFAKEDGLPSSHCIALCQRQDGTIWVATKEGVAQFRGNSFEGVGQKDLFLDRLPSGLGEDRLGRLFLATRRGLFVLEGELFQPFRAAIPLSEYQFTAVSRDKKGLLWFGTEHKGVIGVDGDKVHLMNKRTGLQHDSISSIYADDENLLWIGTDLSLSRYMPGPFRAYTDKHGLPDDFVRTLFIDKDGILWAGTRNGLARMTEDDRFETVDTSSFANPRFYGIAQGKEGTIYFATQGSFSYLKRGVFTHFTHERSLPADRIRAVFVDSRGWVWIGAEGLIRFEGGKFLTLAPENPLSKAYVLQIIEGEKGWLWVGTVSGLIGFQPLTGELKTFEALKDQIIWSLCSDGKGQIWAATNGSGLFYWNGKSSKMISTDDGLGNRFVWQVLMTRSQQLWVGHTEGLDRFEGNEIRHFNRYDGLADNEGSATALVEDARGRIWSGTGYGLSCYDPVSEVEMNPLPEVRITGISLPSRDLGLTWSKPLLRKENSLRFEFSAMRLYKEEEVRYRYRLTGLDEDWHETRDEAFVRYLNLDPGHYRFEVTAAYGAERSPNTALYEFRIMPSLWETSLFKALVVLLLVFSVQVYLRRKTILMERNRMELERMVEEKTVELKESNKSLLETQHRLVEAAHRAGMAEIATGILHNVGNVLNSVNVSLDVIEKTISRGDSTTLLQRIAEMIALNQENLAIYLTENPQGRKLPEAIQRITELSQAHKDKIAREVLQLRTKIFHINEIVRTQQSYAKLDGFREKLDINQLLEDALRIQANFIEKNEVKVHCAFAKLPLVEVPKVQLMQIFINLIKNGVEATDYLAPNEQRKLGVETDLVTIHEQPAEGQGELNQMLRERQIVQVRVSDNGIGIDSERLEKLFIFGYTSKQTGHGFGLHYCANTMEEIGGKIRAESDGHGLGASFILEIPVKH